MNSFPPTTYTGKQQNKTLLIAPGHYKLMYFLTAVIFCTLIYTLTFKIFVKHVAIVWHFIKVVLITDLIKVLQF